MRGSERTITGSQQGFQMPGTRRPRLRRALALAVLLAAAGCGGPDAVPRPEAYARWAGSGPDGTAQVLVTARSAAPIAAAELLAPDGRIARAAGLPVGPADRDYGVAIHGGSDTGVSLGLSLDILARAMDPPPQRRSASIRLPPDLAAAYRRTWRDWQLTIRFADGPTLVQPAPEPRD